MAAIDDFSSLPAPQDQPPSPALLRALAAHPELMADLIAALDVTVLDADALVTFLARAADQAVQVIQGVDWAGVTAQFDGGDPFTAAHTGRTVLIVDEYQYQQHDGPCLEAMRTNRRVHMSLSEVAARWPQLAAGAASTGVHSFLALPLHTQDSTAVGSLNLYSAGLTTLDAPDEDLLTVLTGYLDRALDSYRRNRPDFTVADLHAALNRRTVIEQAIGVLMASHHLHHDSASDLLYQRARTAGQQLDAQARHILQQQQPPTRE